MKDKLGGKKRLLCPACVCQAGSESAVHVWSGIAIAHDDTVPFGSERSLSNEGLDCWACQ